MTLPTPRLDDRTFQQLVDEAKLQVQRRCPQWSDHNVSDPGVTLIETFAWMTDMLLYRLNRVPDRMHLRFLELMGVTLFPPQAAKAEVSFRLSVHHTSQVRIAAGTAVSTRRTVGEQAIGFTTVKDLDIPPAASRVVGKMEADGDWTDLTALLGVGSGQRVFQQVPTVDDALYVGLDMPAPRALVLVQLLCEVGGHGIDPRTPPLVWEAWTPAGWVPCHVQSDDTRGLNVSGSVELHLPAGHADSVVAGVTAAWLRCRVVPAKRSYRSSPEVSALSASTVGGDTDVVNAHPVLAELLGTSDGTAGQRFRVEHRPVLPDLGQPFSVQVGTTRDPQDDDASAPITGRIDELVWTVWEAVDDFSHSDDDSRHVVVDRTSGEIRFGPAVRLADGTVRSYGAVPPRGALLRVGAYRTGGGAAGNVGPGTINVLRSSIPSVAAVYNRLPATGGVDGETVAEAKVRGPLELRRRGRAVTAEDYAAVTREVAPELARVHCEPVTEGADAGALRILVVPNASQTDGRIALSSLRLPDGARQRVLEALDSCRVVGARVSVEPPSYVGVRVDARVRGRGDADVAQLERNALDALYRYFNPLTGGPDGQGWPLGRPVQTGEVHSVLSRLPGLDYVEEVVLFRANPLDGTVSSPQDRIDLAPTHLVVSVEHNVYVESDRP